MRSLIRVLALVLAAASPAFAQDAVINFSDVHQRIDCFGAADRNVGPLTDAQADLFFNASTGIGLSCLRRGIEVDGTPSDNGTRVTVYSNAIKAAGRGARIIATPWSAPGALKDNGLDTNGGHLIAGNYNTWATTLAGVQAAYQSNAGVNLFALGIQNEPDISASYESMLYTTAEMTSFIKTLGPKITALTPVPLLLTPETANWDGAAAYVTAIAADGTAKPLLTVTGAHQYSGTPASLSTALNTWQTEMSGLGDTYDQTITHGLTVAGWIHSALTAGANAWFYWELNGQGTDNEGLIGENSDFTITKRLYTMGNYSKFIRPGSFRVGVTGGPSGVSVSAFKSGGGDQVEIVAINTSGSSASLVCDLSGLVPATVTPWVTSATQNLAALAPITVTAGSFTATIANNTVTTFVGTIAPPARMRKLRIR